MGAQLGKHAVDIHSASFKACEGRPQWIAGGRGTGFTGPWFYGLGTIHSFCTPEDIPRPPARPAGFRSIFSTYFSGKARRSASRQVIPSG